MSNRTRSSKPPTGRCSAIWHRQLFQHRALERTRSTSVRCKRVWVWTWIRRSSSYNNQELRTCLQTLVQVRALLFLSSDSVYATSRRRRLILYSLLIVIPFSYSHPAPWWRWWHVKLAPKHIRQRRHKHYSEMVASTAAPLNDTIFWTFFSDIFTTTHSPRLVLLRSLTIVIISLTEATHIQQALPWFLWLIKLARPLSGCSNCFSLLSSVSSCDRCNRV